MFDPERDEDHDSRRFLWRLLVVATLTVAVCAALYPSVTGFAAGSDHQTGCLAIRDGWKRDRTMSDAELAAAYAAMPKALTQDEFRDPAAVARFREQLRAAEALPEVQQANAAIDWADGPGTCVRASRHRLLLSGIGLFALAAACGGVVVATSATRGRRGSGVLGPATGHSST